MVQFPNWSPQAYNLLYCRSARYREYVGLADMHCCAITSFFELYYILSRKLRNYINSVMLTYRSIRKHGYFTMYIYYLPRMLKYRACSQEWAIGVPLLARPVGGALGIVGHGVQKRCWTIDETKILPIVYTSWLTPYFSFTYFCSRPVNSFHTLSLSWSLRECFIGLAQKWRPF